MTTPAEMVSNFVVSARDLGSDRLSARHGKPPGEGRFAEARVCFGEGRPSRSCCGAMEERRRAESLVLSWVRGASR